MWSEFAKWFGFFWLNGGRRKALVYCLHAKANSPALSFSFIAT
jgi:hypothetical protein